MSEGPDYYRGLIKGYEEGLNQAWDELIGLTTRGYSPREIQVVAKSKRQSVSQTVRERKKAIKEETGIDLSDRPSSRKSSFRVDPGHSYLVEGTSVTRALSIMNEITSDGTKGMCICRSFPGNFEGAMNPGISSFWLTRQENGGQSIAYPSYSPSDLGKIVSETRAFMKEEVGRVILLEGIEYLIVQNDLNAVLKFIQTMVDQTVVMKGVLLLAVYPAAIDGKVLSNLECNIGPTL